LSGSRLYGTTKDGGSGTSGTVFAINTDGTGFTNLHNFTGGYDGANPYGGLILSGTTLYGTTRGGGTHGNGTVFAMNTSGSGFTVLKIFSATVYDPFTFTDTNSDGAEPQGTLVLSGGVLYGTTLEGGNQGYGTVFAQDTTSTNFSVLHAFTDGNDGGNPQSGLVMSGSMLFGTAYNGGSQGYGTVFSINTVNLNFNYVYPFSGEDDGAYPNGSVTIAGDTLYGTASGGGGDGFGTVFAVNTSGLGFTNLYEFDGGDSGGYPLAGLLLSGGTLYGSTFGATGQNDVPGGNGTLFAVNTNGAGFTNIYTFFYSDGVEPYGGLLAANNTLYGTTDEGGSGGNGMVFQINPDGSGYTVLRNFSAFGYNPSTADSATNSDGANPEAWLVMSGGMLYGTAYNGGTAGFGAVFGLNTDGTGFTNLYNFTDGNDGADPQGSLVSSGSLLYGTAEYGGVNNNGTVFAINTAGSGFMVLKTFSALTGVTNSDGANPEAGLVMSGGVLYGTAYGGGSSGLGTVFSINASTTNFANLHNFTGGNDGANPYAGLLLAGSSLYGTAYSGGSNNTGTVFRVGINGLGFTVLKTFSAITSGTNNDGANPQAGLALVGNMLYGTTVNGGNNGYGTVFLVTTNGMTFSNLYNFTASDGFNPNASLVLFGNALYGTTIKGGSVGDGAVFAFTLFPLPLVLNIEPAGANVILTWSDTFASLQSAPLVNGVYTNVPGATSPYTNNINCPQKYYRLEAP